MTIKRCGWCSEDPLYQNYHDFEWGIPVFDEKHLFEMLCLEGQQAGLSWITVLKKRDAYRQHFFQYPIEKIAKFSDQDLEEKLSDAGLIRHLGKLKAIRDNAIAWQNMKNTGTDMVKWLWDFVEFQPIIHHLEDYKQGPTFSDLSVSISKQLKKCGFKFVGPTIIYAFMQAVGMVNDHEIDCNARKTV